MQKGILAVVFVFLLLAPTVIHAEVTLEDQEELFIGQENSDKFTDVTNIIETNETNQDTWEYRPQGRLLCGMQKESLFRLNFLANDDTFFLLASKFTFSDQDIITGSSLMIIRLPVPVTIIKPIMFVEIVEIPENMSNATLFELHQYYQNISSDEINDVYLTYYLDLTDIDGYDLDGNSFYIMNDRWYEIAHCPILPGHTYLFSVSFYLQDFVQPELYFTMDDIASDDYRETYINITKYTEYGREYTDYVLPVDAAWSFLIVDTVTLAGFATYRTIFRPGEELLYEFELPDSYKQQTNIIQNIMIPFYSKETIVAEISVENLFGTSWTTNVGSDHFFLISKSGQSVEDSVRIRIKFLTWANVTFFLMLQKSTNIYTRLYFSKVGIDGNDKHLVFFDLFMWYNQSSDWSWQQINHTTLFAYQELQQNKTKTTTWAKIKNWFFDKITSLGETTQKTYEFVAGGFSAVKDNALTFLQSQIFDKISQYYDKIKDMVEAVFKDLYQEVRNFGNFIQSWGMKIWKVIKYIVKKIVYFFTMIMGILFLALEIIIFILITGLPLVLIYATYLIGQGRIKELLDDIGLIFAIYRKTKEAIHWW